MMAYGKEKKKRCYNTNIKRAIFSYVSKAAWDPTGSALLHCVIGPENSHHPLSQSIKQNENQSQLHHSCFSRASGSLLGFTLYSHWLHIDI